MLRSYSYILLSYPLCILGPLLLTYQLLLLAWCSRRCECSNLSPQILLLLPHKPAWLPGASNYISVGGLALGCQNPFCPHAWVGWKWMGINVPQLKALNPVDLWLFSQALHPFAGIILELLCSIHWGSWLNNTLCIDFLSFSMSSSHFPVRVTVLNKLCCIQSLFQDLLLGETQRRTCYSNNPGRILVVAVQVYKIQIMSRIFVSFSGLKTIYPNIWLAESFWVYMIVDSHSHKYILD